jgi:hypothetical protein
MTNIKLSNRSDLSLTLMIEPIAHEIEIKPGGDARIIMSVMPDEIAIDFYSSNFVSVWSVGETEVISGGERKLFHSS